MFTSRNFFQRENTSLADHRGLGGAEDPDPTTGKSQVAKGFKP